MARVSTFGCGTSPCRRSTRVSGCTAQTAVQRLLGPQGQRVDPMTGDLFGEVASIKGSTVARRPPLGTLTQVLPEPQRPTAPKVRSWARASCRILRPTSSTWDGVHRAADHGRKIVEAIRLAVEQIVDVLRATDRGRNCRCGSHHSPRAPLSERIVN